MRGSSCSIQSDSKVLNPPNNNNLSNSRITADRIKLSHSPRQNCQPLVSSFSANRSRSYKELASARKDEINRSGFQKSERKRDASYDESLISNEENKLQRSGLLHIVSMKSFFESPHKKRDQQDHLQSSQLQSQSIYQQSPQQQERPRQAIFQQSPSSSKPPPSATAGNPLYQSTSNFSMTKQRQTSSQKQLNTSDLYNSRTIQQQETNVPQYPSRSNSGISKENRGQGQHNPQFLPPRISQTKNLEDDGNQFYPKQLQESRHGMPPPTPLKPQIQQVQLLNKSTLIQNIKNNGQENINDGHGQILLLQPNNQPIYYQQQDSILPIAHSANGNSGVFNQFQANKEMPPARLQQNPNMNSSSRILTVSQTHNLPPTAQHFHVASGYNNPNGQQLNLTQMQGNSYHIQQQQLQQQPLVHGLNGSEICLPMTFEKENNIISKVNSEGLEVEVISLRARIEKLTEIETSKKEQDQHQQELEKIIKMLIAKNEELTSSQASLNLQQQISDQKTKEENAKLKMELQNSESIISLLRKENDELKIVLSSKPQQTEGTEMLAVLEKRIEDLVKENERVTSMLEIKEEQQKAITKQLLESAQWSQKENSINNELREMVQILEKQKKEQKVVIEDLSRQHLKQTVSQQLNRSAAFHDNQIKALKEENQKLAGLLKSAEVSNSQLTKEKDQFEVKIKQTVSDTEKAYSSEIKELNYWKNKCIDIENKLKIQQNSDLNNRNNRIIEHEDKLTRIMEENERLNKLLTETIHALHYQQSLSKQNLSMPSSFTDYKTLPFLQLPEKK